MTDTTASALVDGDSIQFNPPVSQSSPPPMMQDEGQHIGSSALVDKESTQHNLTDSQPSPPPMVPDESRHIGLLPNLDASGQDDEMMEATTKAPSLVEEETIKHLLFLRLGFTLASASSQPDAICAPANSSFFNWKAVCRTVGASDDPSIEQHQPLITNFLDLLLSSEDPYQDIPSSHWDLHPLNPERLSSRPSRLLVKCKVLKSDTLYILRSLEDSESSVRGWFVAVNGQTALECIRRNLGPSLLDITLFLAQRGFPFTILRPKWTPSAPQLPPSLPTGYVMSLGKRPADHVFTVSEFLDYEQRRDAFIQTHPHARRALRMGGVYGRLARVSLDPTNSNSLPPRELYPGRIEEYQSDTFIDDCFTPEELRFLVGAYDLEEQEQKPNSNVAQKKGKGKKAEKAQSGTLVV